MADTIVTPDVEANAGNVELKENTIIVVLGASGDLAKKKTVSFIPSITIPRVSANKICTVPRSFWTCELVQHTSPPISC
jgi:glucose-6-phosphate 1-dehydrogenase